MKREKLEHLVTTRNIQGKHIKGNNKKRTNKMAKYNMRYTKNDERLRCVEGHDCLR